MSFPAAGDLAAFGLVAYEWHLASDRLVLAPDALRAFGLPDLSAWSTGAAFAALIEPGAGPVPADLARPGPDRTYRLRYAVRLPRSRRVLAVDDCGRLTADPEGRPVRARGAMWVRPRSVAADRMARGAERARARFLADLARDVRPGADPARPVSVVVIREAAGLSTAGLRAALRRRDALAELGDGRLALALRDCPAARAAEALARLLDGGPPVTAAAGVATFPDDARDAETLLRRAERAAAAAPCGPGPSLASAGAMTATRPAGAPAGPNLADWLRAGRIVGQRRPVMPAGGGEPAFFDLRPALATPAGPVPIDRSALDRSGLEPTVDARVAALAADALAADPLLRLAIRVAPETLRDQDGRAALLAPFDTRPDIAARLLVETTGPLDGLGPAFGRLRAAGLRVGLARFGWDWSASPPPDVPLDAVRLDGPLVLYLARSRAVAEIVGSRVAAARAAGLSVAAEWVDDRRVAGRLAGWGVDHLIGDVAGQAWSPAEAESRVA